jgi:GNAT superfamily N-acetyltransferase
MGGRPSLTDLTAKLRPAAVEDAVFISRVVITSWQDAYSDFLPPSFLASLYQNPHHDVRSWERRIREPGSANWIILNQGIDVGVLRMTIGASSIPGTDAALTTLYLLRQVRGRGLGSMALLFARGEASRKGSGVLGVCVLADSQDGKRFYERRGARQIGERLSFRLDQKPIMEILYRFDDPWSAQASG